MGIIKEFKEFALKGNMVDMAVGIIIGAAFGTIVTSLVNDVMMPPLGKLMGNVDFSDMFINLSDGEYQSLEAAETAGAPVIAYGKFINSLINFFIVAAAVFVMVKMINTARKKFEQEEEEAPKAPTPDQVLLEEIRDELRKGNATA